MTERNAGTARTMGRRAAMLLPLAGALGGCSIFDDLFSDNKVPIPGKRESIALTAPGGLEPDASLRGPLALPPPVANADWPQAGGNPAHLVGQLAAGPLHQLWRADIGEGGGYREKITAQPVIAGGRVFTMDSDGFVSAFDVGRGARLWRTDTEPKKSRSSNVGGGLAWDGGRLYAGTGRAELLAIDPANGKIGWRKPLGAPARSAPTVAGGRVYLATLDDRMQAFDARSGDPLWTYQAQAASTSVLGEPAPAYADGLVVGGFGSGDLVTLRADSGTVAWSDSLASVRGRNSLEDFSAIRGLPVIANGRVYAVGLGGLMLALDLRSGRRLWERDVASGESPWVAGDWIFLLDTRQQLAALSAADGRVRWLAGLPRYENEKKSTGAIFWRGPILAGNRLLLGSTTGVLLAADPQNGKVVDQVKLPDAVSLAPVAAGGKVYALTDDGSLTAFG